MSLSSSPSNDEAFQKRFTFEERKSEAERIRLKYPDRVPVIVERDINEKSLPALDKKKYLVPQELTVSQFLYVIRKRLKLPPETALFMFADKHTVNLNDTMEKIYTCHHASDMFIYLIIKGENTFGTLNC
jgi:GABA(A) receptor-associated protein